VRHHFRQGCFWSVQRKKNSAGPFGPVRSVEQILLYGARAAIPASMVLTFPFRLAKLAVPSDRRLTALRQGTVTTTKKGEAIPRVEAAFLIGTR
jgi:hypothetical protein